MSFPPLGEPAAPLLNALGCHLLTIGILPTIQETLLTSAHISKMVRYQALNDRVMALRDGKPLDVDIQGQDTLAMQHADVMLEAAATSFQIHLQCKPANAVRDFNAALIASAPMVAASANSPALFNRRLWAETRIPLFEQAVDVGPHYPKRVGFAPARPISPCWRYFWRTRRTSQSSYRTCRMQRPASSATHASTTAPSGAGTVL